MRDDGLWELDANHGAVRAARQAVRERIGKLRRRAQTRPDPSAIEAARKTIDQERKANAKRFAAMRRAVVYAFPPKNPELLTLLDVGCREIATFIDKEIREAKERLAGYDIIAAVDVRPLLRALRFEPGQRHLADLGPPQKTKQINRRGRTLRITPGLLVQGSCGINHPFAAEDILRQYLRNGDYTKLRRRIEADAKSLFALYQYGCLHGTVRLRWGFLDERLPAPWVHSDEPVLYTLMRRAHDLGVALEIVAGTAPGWADPWSRVQRVHVHQGEAGWPLWLVERRLCNKPGGCPAGTIGGGGSNTLLTPAVPEWSLRDFQNNASLLPLRTEPSLPVAWKNGMGSSDFNAEVNHELCPVIRDLQ